MKTTLTLLLFCLIGFFHHLSAQVSVGFRTGYNNSWENYGDVNLPDNAKTHVDGMHFTGLAYVKANQYFDIGVEPGYAQKGAACYPGSFYFLYDTKFQLNYIEMPVMIVSNFPLGQKHLFGISTKIGLGASYLVSAFRESKPFGSDDEPVREKEDLSNSSLLKRWDTGFYAGLGVTYNLGNNQLFLESNYYHGFIDAFKISTSPNRSIYIGLGYLIKV